ncbi:Lrp/AsnC family transcriptional regulator [Thermoproteota archaeon]
MKRNEKEIIELLKANSRISVKEIACITGLAEKDIEQIIKKLESKGVILQYTTVVNEDKIDSDMMRALVHVSIRPEKRKGFDAIAQRTCKYKNVVDLYLVSGQYDFLVIIEGKSLQEISYFVADKLASLDNIRSTETVFIMKRYKEKGVTFAEAEAVSRLAITP